ncbi:MAG: ABC transporter ATP-binding protein/permease [Lactobacillales bacterium]|jgi:ATP-binding cassette subfamily B protein|nr:ABC transporter ATP-binding protein/permease [Lactobacillales bacterium]
MERETEAKSHEAIPMKEQWMILKRMFQFTKPYRKTFAWAIIAGLALSVVNVLLPFVLKDFLDNYLTKQTATTKIIFFFAGLYLFGTIIKAIVWFFQWFLYEQATSWTNQNIRLKLFEKIHTLGMRFFDQVPAGSIVSRLTNDTNLFDFWFVFLMVLTGVFSLVTSFIAMLTLNVKVALITLIFLPFLLLAIYLYQKFSSQIYREMREKLSELNTKLNEYISGMRIIQQFRQENRLEEEFSHTNEEYLNMRYAMTRTNALLLSSLVNLMYSVAVMVALSVFGFDALQHPVEAGVIYAFLTNLQLFFNPISQMMDFLSVFTDGVVAGSRIIKILDNDELTPQQNPNANATITKGKIEFRNVSFSYDGEHNVLNNISFIANPGETVALVGHTGSGKSSIINVLMRFYEFSEGQILIDDVDIRDFSIEELREKLGLVLQDAFMFVGDIAGNIRMMNENITHEQVVKAAKFVQADQFITNLDGQYHAEVIERGASYSSGQRQLLSFARTIVTDPKILVLDEATANIDTETETLIQEGLANMRQGRTTIAIAHRLSTIRDANLILVLDNGEIVERGTHEELIEKGGYYSEMYHLQSMKAE